MSTRQSSNEIARIIVQRDPAFADVVKAAGPPPRPRPARVDDRFPALVRSITFQLLATKAATTIHQRVVDVCSGEVTVERIVAAGTDQLRSAGLSGAKAASMIELAHAVTNQEIRLERHGRMTDVDVINEVKTVRGIGPWTAQMYLMFTLARPDVWPTGDYGVRNGWTRVHGLNELVSERELHAVGGKFDGVRSAVAWYCWRAVDLDQAQN